MRVGETPRFAIAAIVALTVVTVPVGANAFDPWLDAVRRFSPGEFAGFGQSSLPHILTGPPYGGGPVQGSVDVVSLGNGGSIVVAFRDNVVVDGPGDDLVVFENAFHSGSEDGPIFTEYGIVAVSPDGRTWSAFPFDAGSGEGLAGRTPVLANPLNGIDPLAPEAGGDRFDIAALGLQFVRFVRITDGGDAIPDAGNQVAPADKGGFDLDAIGAIHSTEPGVVNGIVTAAGEPVATTRVRLVPADGTRTLRRRTHADGRFRFRPVLPSGGYRVVARRAGLGRAAAVFEIDALHLAADLQLELD